MRGHMSRKLGFIARVEACAWILFSLRPHPYLCVCCVLFAIGVLTLQERRRFGGVVNRCVIVCVVQAEQCGFKQWVRTQNMVCVVLVKDFHRFFFHESDYAVARTKARSVAIFRRSSLRLVSVILVVLDDGTV